MSRKVEQLVGRWQQKKLQRKRGRELEAASPRLREEYLAALRSHEG